MPDLSKRAYIKWDAKGVEQVPPSEAEDIRSIVDKINDTQRRFYEQNGHCFGGTHARTQEIVKGTLYVSDNLPPHLKQTELFSQADEYPVICRYSSEPSDLKPDDRIPQPRSLAMKIFNVQGEMFEFGKDFLTQDIEFNGTPAIDLADAKTTKETLDLRLKSDKELQQARNQVPNMHPESTTFYSQTAYRFGDYVIKYNLVPYSQTQKMRSEETAYKQADGILHEWLQEFYRNNEAKYRFQVQLLESIEDQPVEYGVAEWDSEKYPWQTVAKLGFPKQRKLGWGEE
ncbi:heme-dependent catalase [Fusarium austroafricanum]|uniref:Heme-dependent catalase n=1 Tax=Fusarium austroafricanum TaxID=2364996 RepID=A0A8H4KPE7_9HYPO|nr:heme-dependent catalase [Fusarium austroafricanum]